MSDQRTNAVWNEREPDAVPVTGLDPVDRVLALEAAVSELPVNERAAAYRQLHAELESVLNQHPGSLPAGLTGQ
ncbi:hypothetical protein GCM10025781_02650 [Kocuria gwangalliensis]|uniref:Uncharacterized protein n=1 Tax=Kocuria gwangalliensis TaxID=501592 RepID=A0ABP8WIA3_9MICC